MKIGVQLGNLGTFGDDPGVEGCIRLAEAAEALGYDSVWVSDHVVLPAEVRSRYPYNESGVANFAATQRIYEPMTVLAAVAMRTTRISLGTGVLIVPYRNPLVLAGVVSTVDHLSRGRVIFGIGVGWLEEEFEALGIASLFHRRGSVTDERMRVMLNLWTQDMPRGSDGDDAIHFDPVLPTARTFQRPHPPIWVGGKTEASFRRIGRYGSGFISISSSPEELRGQAERVRHELELTGRDPAQVEVAISGGSLNASSKEELIDRLSEYAEAGLTHLTGVPSILGRQGLPGSDAERLELQLENLQYFAAEIRPSLPQSLPLKAKSRLRRLLCDSEHRLRTFTL